MGMEKTERAGQSFKQRLWDLDEECHIEGETEFEAAVAEFFLRINVSLDPVCVCQTACCDDPIDCQLLTADPHTDFQRTNDMRAAQRALFKQNSARAVQAAGLARHRSEPKEDVNAGDTAIVWPNNRVTGRRGWTGPGVVVAVSPTRTSFWISMSGCLLKCSGEQVRKATDAEWLGAELSRTLATELLNCRQRSGQRGYVDVEPEGQPTEDPPADTRPDVHQILGANAPAPGALASIPEEANLMDTAVPQGAETGSESRPRQLESEPGSEPVDRNVRPRLVPELEHHRTEETESDRPTTQTAEGVQQAADGASSPFAYPRFSQVKTSLTPKCRQSLTGVSMMRHGLTGYHPSPRRARTKVE